MEPIEHVFPIRCSIREDSPHINSSHQRDEIEKHRVVLVENSGPSTPAFSKQRPPSTPSPDEFTTGPTSPLTQSELDPGHILCEEELITIPGGIQALGMLVGLEMVGEGEMRYICRVVSDNSLSICQHEPSELFGLDDFVQLLSPCQHSVFRQKALDIRSRFMRTLKSAEPEVFLVDILDSNGSARPVWCAMHYVGGAHNLLICEFELQGCSDVSAYTAKLPEAPSNLLGSDPDTSAASFERKSLPLDLNAGPISVFEGQGHTMENLHLMSRLQQQLSSQTNVQDLFDVLVGLTQELTGYHRVMVYRFDPEFNGEVVSELVDRRASSDTYRGLHFPVTDIPKQARELYQINRVRTLFDRNQGPSLLVANPPSYLDTPLDQTHAYLRAMSPAHLKYLDNIGVQSTMSISLTNSNTFWGLIVCHAYSPNAVPFPVRELCFWLGLAASTCLEKLLQAEILANRKIAEAMESFFQTQAWLSTSSARLLHIFSADYGFLVIQGEARTIGKLTNHREAVTLLRYVYFRNFEDIFASSNITRDFTDLVYPTGFKSIAGLLCVPLSQTPGDFVLFFRASRERVVRWGSGGNPEPVKQRLAAGLDPRSSFKQWTERVKGTSIAWTDEQHEAAALMKLVYGNFIRVWRDREAALNESRMKRLLIVNLSHEVRTPLNAVVNYLEIALEQQLDRKTKEILWMSHTASKSLIFVIDELLHLTGCTAEPPPPSVKVQFNLHEGVQNALELLKHHAVRKGLTWEILQDDNLPRLVLGDLQRLQQAVTSLVTNAIQYTETGGITVHLGLVSNTKEDTCVIRISVQDTGKGMSEEELDNLFQEFEQLGFETNEDRPSEKGTPGAPSPSSLEPQLGLGLAVLARFIKHTGGQIRGKSVLGVGTTFVLEVPFKLADSPQSSSGLSSQVSSRLSSIGSSSESPARDTKSEPVTRGSDSPSTPRPSPERPFRPSYGRGSLSHPTRPETWQPSRGKGRIYPPFDPFPHSFGNRALTTKNTEAGGFPREVPAVTFDVGSPNIIGDIPRTTVDDVPAEVPSQPADAVLPKIDPQNVASATSIENNKIIVADDNPINCTILMRRLQKLGYDVKLCSDGQEAFDTYQKDRNGYNFVLMDINMPIVDGVQATQMIRAIEEPNDRDTPVNFPSPAGLSPGSTYTPHSSIPDSDEPLKRPAQRVRSMEPPRRPGLKTRSLTAPFVPLEVDSIDVGSNQKGLNRRSSAEGSYFPLTFSSTQAPRPSGLSASSSVTCPHPSLTCSSASRISQHIPIFAVSANLNQYSQETLEAAGFDGWVPKPIDFKMLDLFLKGSHNQSCREEGKVKPANSRAGGWFE